MPSPAPAPAPTPAPTPAPQAPTKPAPAEKPAVRESAEVQKAVEAWASAWSRKDVKAYLAAYAKDFQVPGGGSRKNWEQERESRIAKPGGIKVGLSDMRVQIDGDQATVRFRQRYSAATLNTTTSKTLVMVQRGNRWLIQQERVGR
jgi:ketosteroid isomerase-like protein